MDPYQMYQLQQAQQQNKSGKNRYSNLNTQGGAASNFAEQGQVGFGALGQESADLRAQLGRYASGQDSQSAEQLRQGLQQNLAGMRSMAASAAPQNAAMAARTAMMTGGRQASGMAGQQALAGIAERQAATESLGNMIGQQRGMELQAALGSRGQAIDAYGNVLNAKVGMAGQPKGWERVAGLAMGGLQTYASLDKDK